MPSIAVLRTEVVEKGYTRRMRHLRVLRYVDEIARAGSIRQAADRLNMTPSALNRRIMDLEAELGARLFERKPRGVRLTSAGELFLAHAREQTAEMQRLRSAIEDLRGLRRGEVRIACSQALAHHVLPQAIGAFRSRHPLVTFAVTVTDHDRAMAALAAYEVDLVLVFRPGFLANFHALMKLEQRLVVLMPSGHPLAEKRSIRLRDCARHPLALPDRAIAGRALLDDFAARTGLGFSAAVESNSFEFLRGCVRHGGMLSFQIEIGASESDEAEAGICTRAIDDRDAPRADLVLGQLRGRNLPVPAAVFAEMLKNDLALLRSARLS